MEIITLNYLFIYKMKRKPFYIVLGVGISITILIILCCVGLVTPYDQMNHDQFVKYNKHFMKQRLHPQAIERNIFQIWIGESLPEKFKSIIEYLKLQNPEYKHSLYDAPAIEVFINKYYPQYKTSYYMIDPVYAAARADFFRYMVVYHYGGVYFDIKSGCSVPLRKIIKPSDLFISSGWNAFVPEKHLNWCVIAKKGHPILRQLLDDIDSAIKGYSPQRDGVGAWGVLNLTGPYRYSAVIEKYITANPLAPHIHYYPSIITSKLVYNYTFKNYYDNLNCDLAMTTKGKFGICAHQGVKKKYNELTTPIVIRLAQH